MGSSANGNIFTKEMFQCIIVHFLAVFCVWKGPCNEKIINGILRVH